MNPGVKHIIDVEVAVVKGWVDEFYTEKRLATPARKWSVLMLLMHLSAGKIMSVQMDESSLVRLFFARHCGADAAWR